MSGPDINPSKEISQQTRALVPWQTDLAKKQASYGSEAFGRSTSTLAKADTALQTVFRRLLGLTSDRGSDVMAAAAPEISTITAGARDARAQIMESIPPGAARDLALANLPMQTAGATAETINKNRNDAYSNLAGLFQLLSGQGMDWFGGGLRGTEGASNTYSAGAGILNNAAGIENNIMQAQAARQRALLGFFGNLAGTASGLVNPTSWFKSTPSPAAGNAGGQVSGGGW